MPASSGRVSEDLINAAVSQLRQGMSDEQSELDQDDKQSDLDRGDDVFFNADDFLQLEEEGSQYESRFFRPSSTVSTNSGSQYQSIRASCPPSRTDSAFSSHAPSHQSFASASRPSFTLPSQPDSAFTPIERNSSGRGSATATSSSDQDSSSPTADFVTPTSDGPFSNALEVSDPNIEEFDGVHPNVVMKCLKGIKTDVLT